MTNAEKEKAQNLYTNGLSRDGVMAEMGCKSRSYMDSVLKSVMRHRPVLLETIFQTRIFRKQKNGWWRARRPHEYLHVAVWKFNHPGETIGEDEEIHHLDFDKDNNAPENLVKMTKSDHTTLHNALGHIPLEPRMNG